MHSTNVFLMLCSHRKTVFGVLLSHASEGTQSWNTACTIDIAIDTDGLNANAKSEARRVRPDGR
jgi:hypothetical protein